MKQQQPNHRIVATLVAAVAAAALGTACMTMPQPQQPPRAVVSPMPEFLAPLEGQHWRLATLGGRPLTGDPQGHPYIEFDQHTGRISGSTGCNRVVGGYRVTGDRISIDQAGATMMACPGGDAAERPFLDALERTERWRVTGRQLTLSDAAGRPLAQFVAVDPSQAAR